MKIERVIPKPPPQVSMTFDRNDGWAIVAALRNYVIANPGAAHRDRWQQWAIDLDKELRRD